MNHEALHSFFVNDILQTRKLVSILVSPVDYADMRKFLPPLLVPTHKHVTSRPTADGIAIQIHVDASSRPLHLADYQGIAILVDKDQPEGIYGLKQVGGFTESIKADSPIRKVRLAKRGLV
jgi:hypothetical protein